MNRYVSTSRLLAAITAAALFAAGCGDDSEDTATGGPPTAGDTAEFCAAALAFENPPDPDIDFETATPEELAAGTTAYAEDTLRPLAERLQATAPDEIADVADAVLAVVDEVAATGEFAPFEDPAFSELAAAGEAFTDEECGWSRHEVTAVDYAYQGLPETVDAGVVRLSMSNEGAEPHEVTLFRKDDGVTESADELLALPEGEVEDLVTFVGQAFAEPGDQASVVGELEPGEYVAVCFIPVGGEDGPPHFTEGMVGEFIVE
ncbi:MAG: hypothetical protein ACRD0U_16050 [Acidimicrobiales bacterium]